MTRRYDEFEVEAALCAWEWVLDELAKQEAPTRAPILRQHIDGAGGYSAARMATLIGLGPHIAAAWTTLATDDADLLGPFDWEYVPAIMATLLETSGDGNLFEADGMAVGAAHAAVVAENRRAHADRVDADTMRDSMRAALESVERAAPHADDCARRVHDANECTCYRAEVSAAIAAAEGRA